MYDLLVCTKLEYSQLSILDIHSADMIIVDNVIVKYSFGDIKKLRGTKVNEVKYWDKLRMESCWGKERKENWKYDVSKWEKVEIEPFDMAVKGIIRKVDKRNLKKTLKDGCYKYLPHPKILLTLKNNISKKSINKISKFMKAQKKSKSVRTPIIKDKESAKKMIKRMSEEMFNAYGYTRDKKKVGKRIKNKSK